jgi:hypothetical protein
LAGQGASEASLALAGNAFEIRKPLSLSPALQHVVDSFVSPRGAQMAMLKRGPGRPPKYFFIKRSDGLFCCPICHMVMRRPANVHRHLVSVHRSLSLSLPLPLPASPPPLLGSPGISSSSSETPIIVS